MKTCKICLEEKSLSEFYTRSARCKPCHNEYTKQHYLDNKQAYLDKAAKSNEKALARNRKWILDYLESHPCAHCLNDDWEVLEFDHLDPAEKDTEISRLTTGSLERIKQEVAKCQVLCANCHRKRTRRQFGWWTLH